MCSTDLVSASRGGCGGERERRATALRDLARDTQDGAQGSLAGLSKVVFGRGCTDSKQAGYEPGHHALFEQAWMACLSHVVACCRSNTTGERPTGEGESTRAATAVSDDENDQANVV